MTRLAPLLATLLTALFCSPIAAADEMPTDYREQMRRFVIEIAEYARTGDREFLVIPQNGEELISLSGAPDGPIAADYFDAISGQAREDLFFGYEDDGRRTPPGESAWMLRFLDRVAALGKDVLVTDYVSSARQSDTARDAAHSRGFQHFAAPSRELDVIPDGAHANTDFLYLINPHLFPSVDAFVSRVAATFHTVVVIDPQFDEQRLSADEVTRLKRLPDGGERTVLAYLSIGEAEDYRAYWRSEWTESPPAFIAEENRDWPGNYTVRYWDSGWKAIILGGPGSSLDQIIAAGFDGVYLDIVDAYEVFE